MEDSNLRGRPGLFTLIELLVVVAIISVLISILLPALSSAREQANKTKCSSNIKQFGFGFSMYADDWSRCLPPEHAPLDGWDICLDPYVKSYPEMSPERKKFHICPKSKNLNISYGMPCEWAFQNCRNIDKFNDPRRRVLLAEDNDDWRGINWGQTNVDWYIHRARANYLFMDIHVEDLPHGETAFYPELWNYP